MSLKAKLEAVIYAAEEPVTLAQLALLFAADALEWKAARQAAAAEQAAEVAGEPPADPQPLLAEGLQYLGLEQTPDVYAGTGVEAANAALSVAPQAAEAVAELAVLTAASNEADAVAGAEPAAQPEPVDAEAEAKRQARQRDRDIKAVLKQLLDELIASSASDDRGVEIREIAGGYRMATKPECHDAVRLFVKSLKPPMKLSLPALETLAVVAYKQPVTAPEVNEIRGVESGGVLGSLLARKLIATAGRKQVIGRPILYKTTREFLLRFGLKDLAELPSMEEFEKMAAAEIEEMEPEAVASEAAADAAEAAAAAEEREADSLQGEEAGAEELTEPPAAAAAAESNSRDSFPAQPPSPLPDESLPSSNHPEAAPAAPETPPAENEAVLHAEKIQEGH